MIDYKGLEGKLVCIGSKRAIVHNGVFYKISIEHDSLKGPTEYAATLTPMTEEVKEEDFQLLDKPNSFDKAVETAFRQENNVINVALRIHYNVILGEKSKG